LVAGIFHKLSEDEAKTITSAPEPLYDFPDELIRNVKFFRTASTEALEAKIEELKSNISTLKEQIDTDRSWKEEFKNGLSQNNEQILRLGSSLENLTQKLGQEIDERKQGESAQNLQLSSSLEKLALKLGQEIDERKQGEATHKANYSVIKGIGIVLGAILGGGFVSLIVMYLAGILNFG